MDDKCVDRDWVGVSTDGSVEKVSRGEKMGLCGCRGPVGQLLYWTGRRLFPGSCLYSVVGGILLLSLVY